jgi:hypothetical protein
VSITETQNPIHELHEVALNTALRLSLRIGRAPDAQTMWERASGSSAGWAAHRLLTRLAEVDPDGAAAFATELLDELEMGDYGEDIADVAEELGLPAQEWIDTENAYREAGGR